MDIIKNSVDALVREDHYPFVVFGIVVYNQSFKDTISFRSLTKSILAAKADRYLIIIYDNSHSPDPSLRNGAIEDQKLIYISDPTNPGISKAYNEIAQIATNHNSNWLVFLDQDTNLPEEAVSCYLASAKKESLIEVKAPILISKGHRFSPSGHILGKSFELKKITSGICSLRNKTFANSGMMVSSDLFLKMGGYNTSIKLDFTDMDFVFRLKTEVSNFEILPFSCEHSSSFFDQNRASAFERYQLYLQDLKQCLISNPEKWLTLLMIDVIHLFNLTFRFRSLTFFRLFFRARISGK